MIDTDELLRVMAALGKRGGQARSPTKTEAAKRNGGRRYCRQCRAEVTSADRQAGHCMQCQTPLSRVRGQPKPENPVQVKSKPVKAR